MAQLLLVDDHPLFREGFAHMAQSLRPAWNLGFAATATEALALDACTPDLAIIDVGLPDDDGFTLVRALAERRPALPAMLISGREDAAVRVRARACGAQGFIAKTAAPEAMAAAIDAVLAGGESFDGLPAPADTPSLTPRQAEVLMLLTEGHANKEIRYRLGIAERTVRAHLTDLFELLGAHSRTQAIIRARELGLIG